MSAYTLSADERGLVLAALVAYADNLEAHWQNAGRIGLNSEQTLVVQRALIDEQERTEALRIALHESIMNVDG